MWSIVHPSRVYWENLDGEWIVYEEASNQTMVLDAASIDILLSLKVGELDEGYLVSQVLDDLELVKSDENRAYIHSVIHNLASIGLVTQSNDAAFPNH